ncbi:hypothetical protein [Ligilactobacillus sp. 110_WCHN]|uniref:Rgg family transcriptional regulator n=1 Tax=Ligilactobacillus sp. 110_WCHN TaxID=3057125 RepID=UPI0026736D6E|nr:hypothetical protein [Ligilactobacillus sp. 110_WCHN]MDO3393440.1 hypothetical protein [Ligilactobacillus sp. 110_WCHN]
MEENYGKIVSNIRTAKGVPIGKLISGVCSRTAYRNFVMNQTGTSVDNFMRLLAKLHVSYTEFKYIANGFETDYEQRFVIDLQKAIAQGNLKRLDALLQRTLNYCAIYKNDEKYRHLACITQLTIDKMKGNQLDENARQVVTNYLIRCETWTHYELMMFNNAMFAFSLDQIRMFREKVIHNLEKYQNLRVYGSESFRVLINMLMVFIESRSHRDIRIMMGLINNYQLNEDMLFEETLRLYFTGILDLINQRISIGMTKVRQALEVLSILNAKDYHQNLKQYLDQIILKYDLDVKG